MKTKLITLIIALFTTNFQLAHGSNEHVKDAVERKLEEYSISGIDFTYLNNIPKLSLEYFEESITTSNDSSPDISKKKNKYFEELKQIEIELINSFYFHNEMKISHLNAIDDIAELKANLHYPLAFSSGCSGHDYYVDTEKIKIIRELILSTTQEIFEISKNFKAKTEKPKDLQTWIQEWSKSDLSQ